MRHRCNIDMWFKHLTTCSCRSWRKWNYSITTFKKNSRCMKYLSVNLKQCRVGIMSWKEKRQNECLNARMPEGSSKKEKKNPKPVLELFMYLRNHISYQEGFLSRGPWHVYPIALGMCAEALAISTHHCPYILQS